MEPIVFKTENGTCYLYSPAVKELLPIPETTYTDVINNGTSDSSLWMLLSDAGYLETSQSFLDGVVDPDAITLALRGLSQIVFEMTTSCNLRCEYCCYGEGYTTFDTRRGSSGNLSFETAKVVLDYVDNMFDQETTSGSPQEPFAISFYGGEPLMNFNVIKEIVEYTDNLRFKNHKVHFTMTTNATMLAKHAEFLKTHNFKLLISLDGNRMHSAYRKTAMGEESFDLVMSNLKYVKSNYPEWFKTFRFNTVFTNVSDVAEIVSWFKSTFNKVPNFSPLHSPTEGSKEYGKICSMLSKFEIPKELMTDIDIAIQSPRYKTIFELLNHLFCNVIYKETSMSSEKQHRFATGTCVPFSKRMFVSYSGELHPCEKVNRDIPLGRIENGQVFIDPDNIAAVFMSKVNEARVICEKCYLQECCTKCVLCYNDGKCDSFTTKEAFAKLLSQAFTYIESNPDVVSLLENNIIIK